MLLVSVPELIENGAVVPVRPDPATPVPVTPAGSATPTSKVRLARTLGTVVLVTDMFGVPPLQIVGELLVNAPTGVGSTFTFTVCTAPLAQPLNLGVIV